MLLAMTLCWPNAHGIAPGYRFEPPVRVSETAEGLEGNGFSVRPEISADGMTVAFVSMASNLSGQNAGAQIGVYWADLRARRIEKVNQSGTNTVSTATDPSISADGALVAFAGNRLGGGPRQIYLRNMLTGDLTLLSVDAAGRAGLGDSATPAISRDGGTVAFVTSAGNLAPGCAGSANGIVVVDVRSSQLHCVTRGVGWAAPNGDSSHPAVSADGRYVVFSSAASNLVPSDVNGRADVFLFDRDTRAMRLISRLEDALADGDSIQPSISDDGRRVVFVSSATNLVQDDRNRADDVFLWDAAVPGLRLVSAAGARRSETFSAQPRISGDGRFVAFLSPSKKLMSGQDNGRRNIYLWDGSDGSLVLVSAGLDGAQANGDSFQPALSFDGSSIAFRSNAANLVAHDRNMTDDVFIRRPRPRP